MVGLKELFGEDFRRELALLLKETGKSGASMINVKTVLLDHSEYNTSHYTFSENMKNGLIYFQHKMEQSRDVGIKRIDISRFLGKFI